MSSSHAPLGLSFEHLRENELDCLRIDANHSFESEQQTFISILSVEPSVLDNDPPSFSINQCSNQALEIKSTHSHGSDYLNDANRMHPGAIHKLNFEASQDMYCHDIAIGIKEKLKDLDMTSSPRSSDSDVHVFPKSNSSESLADSSELDIFTKSPEKVKDKCLECVRIQ